jgi:hypothetical protein
LYTPLQGAKKKFGDVSPISVCFSLQSGSMDPRAAQDLLSANGNPLTDEQAEDMVNKINTVRM